MKRKPILARMREIALQDARIKAQTRKPIELPHIPGYTNTGVPRSQYGNEYLKHCIKAAAPELYAQLLQ